MSSQGVFDTVCLAHDTLLDRSVAIKELTITSSRWLDRISHLGYNQMI